MTTFAIYYRDREYARVAGDPQLGIVDAVDKDDAERRAGYLDTVGAGVWAVSASHGGKICRLYRQELPALKS